MKKYVQRHITGKAIQVIRENLEEIKTLCNRCEETKTGIDIRSDGYPPLRIKAGSWLFWDERGNLHIYTDSEFIAKFDTRIERLVRCRERVEG